jgi:alpha-glucosidase (family GH31 glycosyl hydrolase)
MEPSYAPESLEFLPQEEGKFFYFQVRRPSTGAIVFDTSLGFIFSDQFIQIATKLPSDRLYGIGENSHQTLKHDMTGYTGWAMFTRDQFPDYAPPVNHYGVFPMYIVFEKDGKASGFLMINSNAMDAITGPAPFVSFRTLGGMLDMFYFPGPTVEMVVQQYMSLVGRPMLPAYFAFGFQLCRYGYKDLQDVRNTVQRMSDHKIPLEGQYIDIDYMDRWRIFTYDKNKFAGLPEFTKELQDKGIHLLLIFDPAIEATYPTFQRGKDKDVFIKWPRKECVDNSVNDRYPMAKGTDYMLGVVWPSENAAFPDFLKPETHEWWIDEIKRFHKIIPFGAIWIDMNEPANFGTNGGEYPPGHPPTPNLYCRTECLTEKEKLLELPPYTTLNGDLRDKTICMTAKQGPGGKYNHYDVHSIYGAAQAEPTSRALRQVLGKRSFIVSRSTFPGTGSYVGHWTGDNTADWRHLRMTVYQVIEFNLFGIPYVGSDICGFWSDTTEEMCLRWHQMGAFHSFSRNHNSLDAKNQDPAQWPTVAAATRKALSFRYKFLPTLYSLHQAASMHGGTVIRGLFMLYPNDPKAHQVSYQFTWGDSLLISPCVHENDTTVEAYFPDDVWYSVYDHDYGKVQKPGYATLPAPWDSNPPLHVRGGSILFAQPPKMTTIESRKGNLELLIAPDANGEARGELYWDDGESQVREDNFNPNVYRFKFTFRMTSFGASLTVEKTLSAQNVVVPLLEKLEILGVDHSKHRRLRRSVAVNGHRTSVRVEKAKALRDETENPMAGKHVQVTLRQPVDIAMMDNIEITFTM